MKKVLSFILCAVMILSGAVIGFAGKEEDQQIVGIGHELPQEHNIMLGGELPMDLGLPNPEDEEIIILGLEPEIEPVITYVGSPEDIVPGTGDKSAQLAAVKAFGKKNKTKDAGRGDVIALLWTMSGERYVNYAMDFADVDFEDANAEAIRWAAAEKIILGYGDGSVGVADGTTTEQLATILYRHAVLMGIDTEKVSENVNTLSYDDIFEVSDWAAQAVHWALAAGILEAEDGKVLPQAVLSRGMVAGIMEGYIDIF